MHNEKEIRWVGSSYDDILDFPSAARREAGFQRGRLQVGLDPEDWKPFDDVGSGVREIRVRDTNEIYRVMYVAKVRGSGLRVALLPEEDTSDVETRQGDCGDSLSRDRA